MVSSSHEAMHRIFQEDPGVFARTFRALGVPFDEPVTATLLPTDLTETRPLERRVDTLLRLDGETSGSSFLLVVEAQGKKDLRKHASWVNYLGHLNEKYGSRPCCWSCARTRTPPAGRADTSTSVHHSGRR